MNKEDHRLIQYFSLLNFSMSSLTSIQISIMEPVKNEVEMLPSPI